jgi:predicted outer membrane repeat protein
MKSSIIRQNKATLDGGGAFSTYHQAASSALFENILFEENVAIKGSGGVFYFHHLQGIYSFIDCNFTKN